MKRLLTEIETEGLLADKGGKSILWRECNTKNILHFIVWVIAAMGPYLWSTVLFAETSFFVEALPEKKVVPDYLSVITQLMVLVAVPGFLMLQAWLNSSAKILAIGVMVVGLAASILSAFFWSFVHVVNGESRSVGLYLCTFLGGPIAALSVISIWPLAVERGLLMISAVVTGTALTQILGVVLSIVQGAGDHAAFSPRTFFLIAAGIQTFSLVVFVIYITMSRSSEDVPLVSTVTEVATDDGESLPMIDALSLAAYGVAHSSFINFLHGAVQGTMSFRFSGWEGLTTLLHTASMCALGVGAAVPIFTIFVRSYRISVFSCILTLLWVPLFIFAFLSKSHMHPYGGYALLVVNVLFGSLFSFSDIMILVYTTKTVPTYAKRRAARVVGSARQIGASVSSLLTLALVVWYQRTY